MQNNNSNGSCASFARRQVNKFAGGAMAAAVLTSPALADTVTNLAYPSVPASWAFYNGFAGASPTVAPDGTRTGVVVNASGTGGGIYSGARFPVRAGTVYTSSKYLRVSNGDPNLKACIGTIRNEGAIHCLIFNGVTGAFISLDPKLADYAIAPVAQTGWWRASVTFKPTSTGNAYLGDFSATTGIFQVWGEQLEKGQYQSRLIPTTTGPASGVNQLNPNSDSANLWSATNGGATQVTGRAGGPLPAWKFVTNDPDCQSNTISTYHIIGPEGSTSGLYIYFYVGKSSYFTLNINHPALRTISAATITYRDGQIYAKYQPQVPSILAVFGYTYGIFNAGKFDVVWVALEGTFGPPYPGDDRVFMDATLTSEFLCWEPSRQSITLGRVGIQSGGIFP